MLRAAARIGSLLLTLSFALHAEPAEAFAHRWKITELYSNDDGSIQFVELYCDESCAGETAFSQMYLVSQPLATEFDFNQDLAGDATDRYLLAATAGFAELPGGIEPDFILPPNFIYVDGVFQESALEFWSKKQGGRYGSPAKRRDQLSAEDLPGESMSLHREFGDTGIYGEAAEPSPTNYAGEVGTLPEPDASLLGAVSLAALCLLARLARRLGSVGDLA